MSHNTRLNPGADGDLASTNEVSDGGVADGAKVQRVQLGTGTAGTFKDASADDPIPVEVVESALPDDAATETKQDAINAKLPALESSRVPVASQIVDGASAALKATVRDYVGSNPLAVVLTDTAGDPYSATGGGGGGDATAANQDEQTTELVAINAELDTITSKLPSTVASSALQTTGNTSLSSIDTKLTSGLQKAILRGGAKGATVAADVTSTSIDADHNAADVAVKASALPTGASTAAAQATGNTSLASIDGKLPASVAAEHTTAASPNATRLSDGAAFYDAAKTGQLPAALVSSRLDVNVGGNSVGLATSAKQDTQQTSLSSVDTKLSSQATATKQDTGNTSLSSIDGKLTDVATQTTLAAASAKLPATLGQKAMAASLAVAIASDQSAVPVSGTVAVTGVATSANQATEIASLASIDTKLSSQATATKQDTGNTSLGSIDTKLTSQATAAKQDTGNASLASILLALFDVATATLQSAGNTLLSAISGKLPAALVGGRLDVVVGAALPAGTNNIGDVDVLTSPLTTDRTATGTLAGALQTVEIDISGAGTVAYEIDAGLTFAAGNGILVGQVTRDGTNWQTVSLLPAGTSSYVSAFNAGTLPARGLFVMPQGYSKARIIVSTWDTGSSAARLRAVQAPTFAFLNGGTVQVPDGLAVTSSVIPVEPATVTGLLGGTDEIVSFTPSNNGSLLAYVAAGLVGTIVFEGSADGGATLFALKAFRAEVLVSSITDASLPCALQIAVPAGCDYVQLRVSAYTSGSSDVAIRGSAPSNTALVANTVAVQGNAAHDAAAAGDPVRIGAKASAAAPSNVSADNDAVDLWALRSGALAVQVTAGGALVGGDAGNGIDVDVTRLPAPLTVLGSGTEATALRVTIATDCTGVLSIDDNGGNVSIDDGGNSITTDATGTVAHDAVGTAVAPLLVGGYASAAAPTDVNADGDAVRAWLLRNGSQAVVLTAAGALIGGDASNGVDVDVTRVQGFVTVQGGAAHDAAVSGSPLLAGFYASALAPTSVSTDGDAVRGWATLAGAQCVQLTAAGTLLTATAGRLDVNLGASGIFLGVQGAAAHDAPVSSNPILNGLYASAAAPTDVSADGDAVRAWGLRNGSQVVNIAAAGALIPGDATNGLDCDVTRVIPGTSATHLGKAEDAVHTTGDTGVYVLAVRADTPAAGAADGDYVSLLGNSVGAIWASQAADPKGGSSVYRSIDLDESEEEVKATAGKVYGFYAVNRSTAPIYLKFYDATAASVVVGTTVPYMTCPIPGSSTSHVGAIMFGSLGINFGTAISIAATTGLADNDTGAPAANDLVINVFYK